MDNIPIALALFHEDKRGINYRTGSFLELCTGIREGLANDEPFGRHRFSVENISKCLWEMETTVLKLNFLKACWEEGKLDDNLWMLFAQGDIEFFLIALRSAFDYVSKILCLVTVPEFFDRTFREVRQWTLNPESDIPKMGTDVAGLFQGCDWFDDLRDMRDRIIHSGSDALVFPTKGRILFKLYKAPNPYGFESMPRIMYNPNIIDFEMFAALHYGNFIALLEDASEIALSKPGFKPKYGTGWAARHPGLRVLRELMEDLVS